MIELKVVPIDKIQVGERFRNEYGDIDFLAASLKKEGIIQPLAVKDNGDGSYILLAGGRRIKAAIQAEIKEVPIRVFPNNLNDLEMLNIELMENVARKDLSWAEAATLKSKIYEVQKALHGGEKTSTAQDAPGFSKRDLAAMLGLSVGNVVDDINLAKALDVFPQLKEADTKSDAQKMLRRLQEELVLQEIAKREQAKTAGTPTEVVKQGMIDSYIIKDFFEGVKTIPYSSIDIVEIDPPYAIGLGDTSIKKSDDSLQGVTKDYNEVKADQYLDFMQNLASSCYKVMSDNSWLICWFAQEPWFEPLYQTFITAGLKGNRIPGIWYKQNSPGQCNHPDIYMANSYETFFYFRKGNPAISRQGRSNVFMYKPVGAGQKVHPTERPIEMIQEVLQVFGWAGARVLVPFLGSGNTLLAANNLSMPAFGYDLSEQYKNAYILSVTSGRLGAYRSYRIYEPEVEDAL
jgi:ParB/RepB/Spo0J family partition protein